MLNIIIASLFCFGCYTLLQDGMLLGVIGNEIRRINDNYKENNAGKGSSLLKPLGTCYVCMASVYGAICFFVLRVPFVDYWQLIAVCGLNKIINYIANSAEALNKNATATLYIADELFRLNSTLKKDEQTGNSTDNDG